MLAHLTEVGPVFSGNIPVVLEFAEGDLPLWEIKRRKGESWLRLVRTRESEPPRNVDPWKLRERFLSLRTEADLLSFLNSTGLWDPNPPKRVSDYWEWQRVFIHLLTEPEKWSLFLAGIDPLKLLHAIWYDQLKLSLWSAEEQLPFPRARTNTILNAILASIRLDLLQGKSFKICARQDCAQQLFSVDGRYKKQYCSQYCGHLESLRRIRKGIRTRRTKRAPVQKT